MVPPPAHVHCSLLSPLLIVESAGALRPQGEEERREVGVSSLATEQRMSSRARGKQGHPRTLHLLRVSLCVKHKQHALLLTDRHLKVFLVKPGEFDPRRSVTPEEVRSRRRCMFSLPASVRLEDIRLISDREEGWCKSGACGHLLSLGWRCRSDSKQRF